MSGIFKFGEDDDEDDLIFGSEHLMLSDEGSS
jgi:hypothetical protein